MVVISTSLLFILTVLQTTVQPEDCDCTPLCDTVVSELAGAESDRTEKFDSENTRFDIVDESILSLKSYLKTEIDAQSGMINLRFEESTTNINNEFESSTNNINNQFSSSTNNINQKYTILSNQMNDQSTMISLRFNTLAYGLRKNISLTMKTIKEGNIDIVNEVQATTDNIKFQLQQDIDNVNETINLKIQQIKDFIDNLNYNNNNNNNNNNNPSSEKGQINMMIEEDGLIVFKIKSTDLYIFSVVFTGLMIIIMVFTHILWMTFCNGYHSGQCFAALPKYDYSTSDVEALNK